MKPPYRLSQSQVATVESVLDDHIVKDRVEKFVNRFRQQFDHDEAEIRSVAQEAVLNAVARYGGRELEDRTKKRDKRALHGLVIKTIYTHLLNALKSAKCAKRGGSVFHVPIATSDVRPRFGANEQDSGLDGIVLASPEPNPEESFLLQETSLSKTQEALLGELGRRHRGAGAKTLLRSAAKKVGAGKADVEAVRLALFS